MKSLKSIFLVALAGVFFLSVSSCDKEKLQPVVNFANQPGYLANDTMLAVGDTVRVLLDITWNGKHRIKEVEMRINDVLAGKYQLDVDQGKFSITIIKGLPETEVWDFIVTDEGGNTTTLILTLTKDPDSKYAGLKYFDSIYLGAQSNVMRPGFLSIVNSFYYRLEAAFQNQSAVDFLFYYHDSDKAAIASPGANIPDGVFPGEWSPTQWATKNTSLFQKVDIVPEVFFGMIHDGFIIENFVEASAKRKAKELAAGDIYLFRLEDGKLGIFYVQNVVGQPDGEINIALKIQE